MIMKKTKRPPTHPGNILKNLYMLPLELNVTDLSEALGVSRKTVSKLVNEGSSITADMALRLSQAFATSPELWLNLQMSYDLWQAFNTSKSWKEVEKIAA